MPAGKQRRLVHVPGIDGPVEGAVVGAEDAVEGLALLVGVLHQVVPFGDQLEGGDCRSDPSDELDVSGVEEVRNHALVDVHEDVGHRLLVEVVGETVDSSGPEPSHGLRLGRCELLHGLEVDERSSLAAVSHSHVDDGDLGPVLLVGDVRVARVDGDVLVFGHRQVGVGCEERVEPVVGVLRIVARVENRPPLVRRKQDEFIAGDAEKLVPCDGPDSRVVESCGIDLHVLPPVPVHILRPRKKPQGTC